MRVAVIHEWLTNRAGSEKVVLAMLRAFPDARLLTSIFVPEAFPELDPDRVETSWLDRFGHTSSSHARLAPFLPLAMRSLEVGSTDLVVTSFHNFALATASPVGVPHIVYCHTPTRFVHSRGSMTAERGLGRAIGFTARLYGRIDRRLGRRGDVWVANSRHIAARIAEVYGHQARVIHPPVDVDRFVPTAGTGPRGEHHLLVGRLVPYKRADLAIEAFRGLDAELHVVGSGRDRERLEAEAPANVKFLGHVSDAELPGVMARARSLVFPGEEDFGITPVEAMAAGTPVVAYGRGGVLDTVEPGVTGILFDDPSPDSIRHALRAAECHPWDHRVISERARRFDQARFVEEIRTLAGELVG